MHVVFPVVPFADVGRPAMGVGLLIAEARAAGHSAEAIYFNVDLAARVGLAPYHAFEDAVPAELKGEIETIKAGIIDGSIKIGG